MATSSPADRTLPPRPLLTQRQVAEILGYTPRTVRTLAAAGELRRVVLGNRSTRYLPEDVEAFIERRTSPHYDIAPAGNRREVTTSAGVGDGRAPA